MRSKNAIYNVATNLILQFTIVIYGFIVPKIIISNFGSSVNGLVSSITQFLGYIVLLESGIGPVIKANLYKPIAKKDKMKIAKILKTSERFFKKIAFIFLIYILVLSLLYPLITKSEFGYIYTFSLIIIISISTFSEYYFGMAYKLYLQAEQKTYIISIIQIITYILSITSILVLINLKLSIHHIKLISGLIFVLRPVLQNIYVKKKYKINLQEVKEDYKIDNKWDGIIQHIAYVIHSNTDVALLTLFGSLAEVSVYGVYNMIVNGIKTLIDAFSNGVSASFGDMIAKDEKENLNKKFGIYETVYCILSAICYSCTIIMIMPFVKIYTKNITDINYIRYIFGYLIVISALLYTIRSPYNELVKAAGHFKETRAGALVEAMSNIIISIMFINKLGLIGVALGTIFSLLIRTIDLVYHANRIILRRSIIVSVKKFILVLSEIIIVVIICKYVVFFKNVNYFNWLLNASIITIMSLTITLFLNYIFYKNDLRNIFVTLRIMFNRKKGSLE